MKPKDVEVLRQILEFEEGAKPGSLASLGWAWQDVKVWPATLNRLVVEGFLEVTYSSNSYTGYRLTEKGKALGRGLEAEEALPASGGPLELPKDLFADIIGHEEVKELLRAVALAPRPVHVLLAGPPALAKSLFLWDLERALGERTRWVLGSSSSRAGLLEVLLTHRPRVLLIDELDKMGGEDLAALLSAMEGGRLVRTKVGRMASETLDLRVVAATNRTTRLPQELLSRFALRRLYPYTREEYRKVVVGVLVRREGCDEAIAGEIASLLDGRTEDVRDAIRVARLVSQAGVDRAVQLLLGSSVP